MPADERNYFFLRERGTMVPFQWRFASRDARKPHILQNVAKSRVGRLCWDMSLPGDVVVSGNNKQPERSRTMNAMSYQGRKQQTRNWLSCLFAMSLLVGAGLACGGQV